MLHIELLGEMRITVDGQLHRAPTSQKARQVLARLAEPGGNLARETLAETFWEGTSTSARVSLSTELKNLRRTLGSSSELLTSTRSTVGLRQCEDLRVDIREFAEHFRREQYQEAVALWRGDFLQETSGEWADGRRSHYRRMAARAHERIADEAEVSGDLATAADFARSQRDMLPNEVSGWKRLIRLLTETGDLLTAEAELEKLAARYTSRGHPPPAAVLELFQPTVSPPPTSTIAQPAPRRTAKPKILVDPMPPPPPPPGPLCTGLTELDRLLGGLPEPGLTILAGRPGIGVTTLALTIAQQASLDLGTPTTMFSTESSEAELAQRFLALSARISGAELRRGRVAEQKWPKLLKASQRLAAAPLLIDDTPKLDLRELLAKVQRRKDHSGTRLVIIDSIHGLATDGRPARDSPSIAGMLLELRQAARELYVSIIVTMEIMGDVEKRPDKKPQLQDLPGYFELAAARDLVLLLYRDEYYDVESERIGELDVIVAENRHGPVGKVSVGFDARIPRVFNLAS